MKPNHSSFARFFLLFGFDFETGSYLAGASYSCSIHYLKASLSSALAPTNLKYWASFG